MSLVRWRDHLACLWRRCRVDPALAILQTLALLILLAAVVLWLGGCMEQKQTRSEKMTRTERWSGKVAVPVPSATPEGRITYALTDLPFDVSRSVEESTDGQSKTTTGIDPAAVAQIGAMVAGSLKQAFPALGLLGQTFMGPPTPKGGGGLMELLEGGGTGAVVAAGIAETVRRIGAASRRREDEAWDAAQQAKLDHARADERAKALEAKA